MAFNLTTKSDAQRVMGRTLYSYFKKELWDKVKNGEFFVEPDFKSNTIKLTKPAYANFIRTKTAKTGDIKKTGKARVYLKFQVMSLKQEDKRNLPLQKLESK